MMTNKIILKSILRRTPYFMQTASYSKGDYFDELLPIGKREWVGYGINGSPSYSDSLDYPLPAVRYKEITSECLTFGDPITLNQPLKEKEKGNWKNLSIEEKKQLYRMSFCQTFAEINAPTGEWKSILGVTMIFISIGLWLFILEKKFICYGKPITFSDEWRADTLRRMIDLKMGHLKGIASKWDYEKDDWKK